MKQGRPSVAEPSIASVGATQANGPVIEIIDPPLAATRGAPSVLLRTPALPNVIREGNTPMLHSIIQSGKSVGMQSMDDALFALVQAERIEPQDAYQKAEDKARFEPLLSSAEKSSAAA